MTQADSSTAIAQSGTAKNRQLKPKPRRRGLRILGWVFVCIVVIALIAAGLGVWTVQRSFPTVNGTVSVEGLADEVSVQRDSHGIPTITAETSDDLFFAQGYVHAQDRFWEMDFRRHLTSARLSELFGESQLGTDVFLRTLGWHRVAEQEVEALDAETRSYYEAYADGVNAYLAERQGAELSLEYSVLGLQNSDYAPEPWEPADSVAWLKAMAWDLRTNIEDETARALEAQFLDSKQLEDLYPGYPFGEHPVILADDPAGENVLAANAHASITASDAPLGDRLDSAVAAMGGVALTQLLEKVDSIITAQGEGVGSNSWVVSGQYTATGEPLLANDPHLGAELPSVWTQMQLRCAELTDECPFDVAGFSFSGLPGIVIGHNQDVAWGFTNLTTDVADLFIEATSGDRYWYDGEWRDMTTREETIRVANGEDTVFTVRETIHGPVVSGLTNDFTAIAASPFTEEADGTIIALDAAALPRSQTRLRRRLLCAGLRSTQEAQRRRYSH
ncbi:penicillin acylase family protein [Leucobacter denitrificans]|uniref:penicillin acylase family protein n=1 Tax=Leucobacter denitrificans TaxID=683042 RepID=UPI001FE3E000|nr:penicillin acylase family protein [Leucobacter denitrificans]